MSVVAIVGGHGRIARQLIGLLVGAGHLPRALVRSEDYRVELERLGAEVGLLDLERDDVEGFARAFAGCDAVVFAAGGGADGDADRKRTVDLEGSTTSADAAAIAGIRRFVQISAISVDEPLGDDAKPVWRAYVEAKRDADTYLRASDLDWTIIRPGALTDDPGTGLVTLADTVDRGEVSRADVAAVVAACLDEALTIGCQWELVGGDVPIASALVAAAG